MWKYTIMNIRFKSSVNFKVNYVENFVSYTNSKLYFLFVHSLFTKCLYCNIIYNCYLSLKDFWFLDQKKPQQRGAIGANKLSQEDLRYLFADTTII